MKTYRLFPERTEPTLKIHNRGHYSLTEGDKSSFSMSGHVTYRPTDTAVASATSVSWIRRDLPRMRFELVSEYSACTVERPTKNLFLGFLQFLYSSPCIVLWPCIAALSSYGR